jgi:DNA-binding transcriptional MerR regulator
MILGGLQQGLLNAEEVAAVEARNPSGVSSQEVIVLFTERGIKLSEATFRKYVQLGLLPTSRRVGRKGKHRGSRGVYPVSVIRRINLIKSLMDEGLTLEEIKDSFLSIQNDIERVTEALDSLFGHMDARLDRLEGEGESVRPIAKEVAATRKGVSSLLKQIEKIGSRLAATGPVSVAQD